MADMPNDSAIRCRGGVSSACYHGRMGATVPGLYEPAEDDNDTPYTWRELDSTYRENTDSIICDACYIALGMPLHGQGAMERTHNDPNRPA